MYLYATNRVTTPNLKYANSSTNYCIIMMLKNLKKNLNFFPFLRHEVPFKANNNREAVVVCAKHVVKRPSKRSVLVCIIFESLSIYVHCTVFVHYKNLFHIDMAGHEYVGHIS